MEKLKNQKSLMWIILIGTAGILLLGGIWIAALKRENKEIKECLDREIQQGIAEEVFRLHVIANSDEDADQKLKIQVKTGVVNYLKHLLGEDTTREETKKVVLTHLYEIEEKAEEIIEKQGFDYHVNATVERTYFPDKTYGDCRFPAGEYEALNVRIGKAKGHNWWCVLYPSLCFLEDTYAVVDEEGKEKLQEILTPQEFMEVLQDEEEKKKIKIGFRWF